MVDDQSPEPLYRQVAGILRERIASGDITSRLPSLKTITQEYGVSHVTAEKAVALLRDLRALAKRQGEEAAFAKRVLDLRAQYPGRPGLQERFNEAGLPRP